MAVIHDGNGNAISTDNPLAVRTEGGGAIQPVDIQARLQTTIQGYNAVSIPASSWSIPSTWMDSDGFDKLAVTVANDATTAFACNVYWSNDGSTLHGVDIGIIPSGSGTQQRVAVTDTKARYFKVCVQNGDTIAHTMSTWAYLKA